jgi:hypothetical protein
MSDRKRALRMRITIGAVILLFAAMVWFYQMSSSLP